MTRYSFKYNFLFLLMLVFVRVAVANANDMCNPTVNQAAAETTVALALTDLAEKYNFTLLFPKNMDRPVHVEAGMKLDQLIKMLTVDMNTILRHEQVDGCSGLRLVELTVIPVGEETEFISVEQKSSSQPLDYIYIDNMEQYVTEVLMREHKADLKYMTPEQRTEFKRVKTRLKKELNGEIKQKKKKNKKEKRKKKAEIDTNKTESNLQ